MIRIRSGDTVTELAWTGENIPAARPHLLFTFSLAAFTNSLTSIFEGHI